MAQPMLTLRQLNRATLARQGLLEPLPRIPVAKLVEHIGSLQAQHPDWPPLALQSRLPSGASLVDLSRARARRSVVRASLMRMTVHVVSAEDFWPMSTLTLSFRWEQWRIIFKRDPVTSPLGRRIRQGYEAVLAAMRERPLLIREIESVLAGEMGRMEIPPNRCLWRHFSGGVPLVHVPYPDEAYGRARYAPAADWLGDPDPSAREPDIAADRLARRYLSAFGPASVEDLAAYVGRGKWLSPWRRAVTGGGHDLIRFRDEAGRNLLDHPDAPRPADDTPAPPRLLARWDSLLLAYGTAHRARVLAPEHQATVITRNADVLPTFLVDGMVAGTWLPRQDRDGTPRLELRPFGRLSAATRDALHAEGRRLIPILRRGAFSRYPGTD
ncbi:MAG: winged helix DNA-binding domain-containing protein [Candidatus Limnocylindria bacterium]